MSWFQIVPLAKSGGGKAQPAVTLKVSKAGRFVQRTFITVQPALFGAGMLDWWAYHAAVRVEVGAGEHAGRVRIAPDGPFRLTGPAGKPNKSGRRNAPQLQIPGLPGMPAAGLARTVALWEVSGGALIVTLPWSDAKGAAKLDPVPPAAKTLVPVKLAPATPSPAAAPVPDRMACGVPASEIQVMRKLQDVGGSIKGFAALTHAECKLLQAAEAKGLAEYTAAGQRWSLTQRGMGVLASLAAAS